MNNKCTVLVVDDESRMRKLVKDFLVKKEFDVIEAADGEKALDGRFVRRFVSIPRFRLLC